MHTASSILPDNLVSLLVLGGVVLGFWRQIRAIAMQASTYLIGRVNLDYNAARVVLSYMGAKRMLGSARPRLIDAACLYVRPSGRREVVLYERLIDTIAIVWYRGFPIVVRRSVMDKGDKLPPALFWIRGTINIDDFLREATARFNEAEHTPGRGRRFRVHRHHGRGASIRSADEAPHPATISREPRETFDEIRLGVALPITCAPDDVAVDALSGMDPLEVYSFPASLDEAISEVRAWYASGAWYKSRGIPWTRGWLLVGDPGCGKTSLLRAIAQSLDMPVHSFDLGSMNNEEFTRAWARVTEDGPCMALIEDIDGVFHGRTNVLGERGGGLTFDCLLNAISGVSQNDGVFLGITTNDLSKVDPAIAQQSETGTATRPGRIDRVIRLGNMDADCRRRHAARVLGYDAANRELDSIVAQGEGMTAAQFNDLCVRRALAEYWNGRRYTIGGQHGRAEQEAAGSPR